MAPFKIAQHLIFVRYRFLRQEVPPKDVLALAGRHDKVCAVALARRVPSNDLAQLI
jgi:hypothetical protein